ncbi:MAG: hypothetical protein IKI63_01045 [Clostridia bacterium]|nr:hypothetical protein [Clostridia bacterium]
MKNTENASRGKIRQLFLSTVLNDNLVLVQALGLCPIIAAGVSLQNAVVLTVCTMLILPLSTLLMIAIGGKLPPVFQPPVYTLFAAVLLFLAAFVLNQFISTELYASLYLFLPLMSVTTLFSYHGGGQGAALQPWMALLDSLASAIGFGLVICLVGALREFVTQNTIWGIPVPVSMKLPESALSFSAFILLGIMAAGLQHIKNKAASRRDREEADSRD